jgi:oligopeptide/dipeptide ABC transporter ATP-binding protein
MAPLLSIRDLAVDFDTPEGRIRAVDGLSLDVPAGQTVALVGESGCGKSVSALAVMGLLARQARVTRGSIDFEGRDLRALPARALRRLRGDRLAMVFQEPMTSLNPLLTVGAQTAEPLRQHRGVRGAAARRRVIELFEQVGIRDAAERVDAYPHQFSGGMRQRVMIAMAIACAPAMLIADEPTTALDVTVQAQILALLRELQRNTGLAMLFITHDLGVVAALADTVAVMYAGRVVEQAPAGRLFASARHPYTIGLLRSVPRLRAGPRAAGGRLPVIPGEVPSPGRRPGGCAFHPRCGRAGSDERCKTQAPALDPREGEHRVACWRSGEVG